MDKFYKVVTTSVIFGFFLGGVSAAKRVRPSNSKPARERVPLRRCPVLRKRYMYREHETYNKVVGDMRLSQKGWKVLKKLKRGVSNLK